MSASLKLNFRGRLLYIQHLPRQGCGSVISELAAFGFCLCDEQKFPRKRQPPYASSHLRECIIITR